MAVTARPMSRPLPTTRPLARAGGRPGVAKRPDHGHDGAAHPTTSTGDLLRIGMIAVGVLVLVAVGIAVIWEYGSGRSLAVPQGSVVAPGEAIRRGSPRDAPTVMYRDMRDGRVMVMEIDANGTRIKGTVAKSSLPMAVDLSGEPSSNRSSDPTSHDRVNALGSAFR